MTGSAVGELLKPGVHLDVPAAFYHADPWESPSLSSSIARLLCQTSPLHAWTAHPRLNPDHVREVSTTFDLGNAAHGVFLEGQAPVDLIDADSFRTNAAKDARDASYAAGRIPLLPDQWQRVGAVVEAARRRVNAHRAEPPLFRDGKPEVTLVWTEPNGVCCRARADWLRDDFAAVDDLKCTTLSARPSSWSRRIFAAGYDIQAEFYSRGVEAITGVRPRFRLVVAEVDAPHAVTVFELAPDAQQLARVKVDYALELWRECLESDVWPAYPDEVASVLAPTYELEKWAEYVIEIPDDEREVPF